MENAIYYGCWKWNTHIANEKPHNLWFLKMQYSHDKLKKPLPMVRGNAIHAWQTKNSIFVDINMQYPHYDPKSTLFMDKPKFNIHMSNMEHY
jgi:hypothetical protein